MGTHYSVLTLFLSWLLMLVIARDSFFLLADSLTEPSKAILTSFKSRVMFSFLGEGCVGRHLATSAGCNETAQVLWLRVVSLKLEIYQSSLQIVRKRMMHSCKVYHSCLVFCLFCCLFLCFFLFFFFPFLSFYKLKIWTKAQISVFQPQAVG